MGTLIMKYVAILSLALAGALRPSLNLQLALGFVVCASGLAVAVQALRARKYLWAGVFCSIAILFNPVLLFQPAYTRHLGVTSACIVAFVLSLFLLRNLPIRTIASITEQNPGSDSL
jgi:hypothetical protein